MLKEFLTVQKEVNRKLELRKQNRINSIHSSLAIENNQLSINQVKDVIDGKAVLGDRKDIQEVKNAYKAYQELDNINPYDIEELKRIHGIMTFLVETTQETTQEKLISLIKKNPSITQE